MRLSGRNALRTRQQSRRLGGFGQMWKSGEQGIVYYPLTKTEDGQLDVLVASCWGHNINPKEVGLKRIFVPTLSIIEDGVPKVPDITYQFSKIAPLFLAGAKESKVANIMAKNMSESQRKTVLKKIDEDFEKLSPVVGKLRMVISTECVYVPLDSNGNPDVEKARLVSQDLSDARLNAILAILDNKQFGVEPDATYVEVMYSFGTSNVRQEDGKVTPTGVTKEYSLQNRFPNDWPRIDQLLTGLPDTSETIEKRNSSFHMVEEGEISSAIASYSAIESGSLDSLSSEEDLDRLKKNAEIVSRLAIPISNQGIKDLLDGEETESLDDGQAPQMAEFLRDTQRENARDEELDNTDLASQEEFALGGLGNLNSLTDTATMG